MATFNLVQNENVSREGLVVINPLLSSYLSPECNLSPWKDVFGNVTKPLSTGKKGKRSSSICRMNDKPRIFSLV